MRQQLTALVIIFVLFSLFVALFSRGFGSCFFRLEVLFSSFNQFLIGVYRLFVVSDRNMNKKTSKDTENNSSESEEEFSVEKILDKRIVAGKVMRFVGNVGMET